MHAAAIAHAEGERDPHAHSQADAMVSDWTWMWLDEEEAGHPHLSTRASGSLSSDRALSAAESGTRGASWSRNSQLATHNLDSSTTTK
jgi:hypothetical protein